jgi:non-canonical purine NTP pyrophosphatase (RdgB/HAM1 family)
VPPEGDTRAAYLCAIACVEPGGRELVVHGRCEGRLTHEPRGGGGFGYDPAFIPDDHPGDLTMAELTPGEKDAISHRGRAARELRRRLLKAEEAKRPPGLLAGLLRGGSAARRGAGRSGRGGR